jgi:hypothetical protein
MHVLRLLTGLLLLMWLLPLAGHIDSLFGIQGWFDRQAFREAGRMLNQPVRPMGWSVAYWAGDNHTALAAVYWVSVAAIVLFTLGIATRVTSVLAWVATVSFTLNPAIEYDADAFLLLFTFYLMIGYVLLGQWQRGVPLWQRLLGSRDTLLLVRAGQKPSVAANLALRLMQVHFAIVIVTSGLHKLQFGDWWGGYALWYPLYPAGQSTISQAREHAADRDFFLFVLGVSAYAMIAWQLAFPLFAWRHRTPSPADAADSMAWRVVRGVFSARAVLLGGAVIGWLGLALIWRLPLLGPALFIGCLSYLTPAEWETIMKLLGRVPGLGVVAGRRPAPESGEILVEASEPVSLVATGGR